MTKQQLLDKLQSSDELVKIAYVPVSEVIKWVNELEDKAVLNNDQIDDLICTVVDELSGIGIDLISDYELDMNYREVELTSIDIDDKAIRKAVNMAISVCVEG